MSGARKYNDVFEDLSLIKNHQGLHLLVVNGTRMVVPCGMRKKVNSLVHRSHSCAQILTDTAKAKDYWPHMAQDIKNVCDDCEGCHVFRPSLHREPPTIESRESLVSLQPMDSMGCDLFYLDGCSYMVLVDRYSLYLFMEKLRNEKTSDVISKLEGIFNNYGYPRKIRTDRGPCYKSEFDQYCDEKKIIHEKSSVYQTRMVYRNIQSKNVRM